MKSRSFSHQDLVRIAQFAPEDLARIGECRQNHTCLGFAYQLAYVRLYHRFPSQEPLEIVDEIVTYVGLQLDIPSSAITAYQEQRRTIVNHQQDLRDYLGVRRFGEAELGSLEAYLFDEACRLEQTGPLPWSGHDEQAGWIIGNERILLHAATYAQTTTWPSISSRDLALDHEVGAYSRDGDVEHRFVVAQQ